MRTTSVTSAILKSLIISTLSITGTISCLPEKNIKKADQGVDMAKKIISQSETKDTVDGYKSSHYMIKTTSPKSITVMLLEEKPLPNSYIIDIENKKATKRALSAPSEGGGKTINLSSEQMNKLTALVKNISFCKYSKKVPANMMCGMQFFPPQATFHYGDENVGIKSFSDTCKKSYVDFCSPEQKTAFANWVASLESK